MKKKTPIIDRNTNTPTYYYPAGKVNEIPGIGKFPALVQRLFDDWNEVDTTFKLAAVTADFVYYLDSEGSDDTVMLNRDMKLISDNFFAANDLAGLVERNDGLLWISRTVKYWQRAQFVQPEKITAEIKKRLNEVDIAKLTNEERRVYFAYLNNDLVKYTKPESLMAVISNDLDQEEYSDELAVIVGMLEQNEE